jgi:hypothetical protein
MSTPQMQKSPTLFPVLGIRVNMLSWMTFTGALPVSSLAVQQRVLSDRRQRNVLAHEPDVAFVRDRVSKHVIFLIRLAQLFLLVNR